MWTTDQTIPAQQAHQSRKRKRDDQSIQKSLNSSTKSMSQLSISQAAVPKKVGKFGLSFKYISLSIPYYYYLHYFKIY